MDGFQAFRRAHEHARVTHHEIATLDNLDAHLPREVGVLEVGGVRRARREQHHRGVGHTGGCDVLEHLQQLARIILHWPHADGLEHMRERALHRAAIFQNVTYAGRTTPVVFQHEVLPLLIANQIRAADVDVNILRHIEVHELAAKMFSRKNVVRRDDAVLQNFLLVIDVVQKQIQRRDALREAALDHLPFLRGNDARQKVEGKNFLRARRVTIDVEGHALPHERQIHGLPLVIELLRCERLEQFAEARIMRLHRAIAGGHLIKEIFRRVTVQQARRQFGFYLGGHFATGVGSLKKQQLAGSSPVHSQKTVFWRDNGKVEPVHNPFRRRSPRLKASLHQPSLASTLPLLRAAFKSPLFLCATASPARRRARVSTSFPRRTACLKFAGRWAAWDFL